MWDDDEEEISPWEASRREEANKAGHLYYHIGVRSAIVMFIIITLGVFSGLWLFNNFTH